MVSFQQPCDRIDRPTNTHLSHQDPSILFKDKEIISHWLHCLIKSVLICPGKPIARGIREPMESLFGHDFREVQIYTDTNAAFSASNMRALAYAIGEKMVFAAGQYRPETDQGKWLLAHELTHVIQQSRHSLSFEDDSVCSLQDDKLEHEANCLASLVLQNIHVGVQFQHIY